LKVAWSVRAHIADILLRADAGRSEPRPYKVKSEIQKQAEKSVDARASWGAAVLRPYKILRDFEFRKNLVDVDGCDAQAGQRDGERGA
jgi:hypothetical protein